MSLELLLSCLQSQESQVQAKQRIEKVVQKIEFSKDSPQRFEILVKLLCLCQQQAELSKSHQIQIIQMLIGQAYSLCTEKWETNYVKTIEHICYLHCF